MLLMIPLSETGGDLTMRAPPVACQDGSISFGLVILIIGLLVLYTLLVGDPK